MSWKIIADQGISWEEFHFDKGMITLEKLMPTCYDRGNYIAKVFIKDEHRFDPGCHIDDQDMWPRYYFDKGRAKLEVMAWLNKRGLV